MSAFILTWNPLRWNDEAWIENVISSTAQSHAVQGRWSVGNRNSGIRSGDRAFVLRQHRDRGIVASGTFTSDVYQAEHWDGSAQDANYADVNIDLWLEPDDGFPIEELERAIPGMNWNRFQASGVKVGGAHIQALQAAWSAHVSALGADVPPPLPDEVDMSTSYREGSVTRVVVNRYERDPRARRACLQEHGYSCVVCSFDFEERYGSLGREYIHVHHTKDLATLGPDYLIDPVEHLRPVCPNCHAMLHRETPAMTIAALKRQLRPSSDP